MEQLATPYAYYRGGTSKAAIVQRGHLPATDDAGLEAWILAIYGSPDRRQIDGIGGADILTSKFAVVGPATHPQADIDYTFFQVGIKEAGVARDLNCGNICAAIGPYAVDEGLVPVTEPVTKVRIHATNFGKVIHAQVPVRDGRARVSGNEHIDGVPGSGAPIVLDFRESAGGLTGRLLPTGNVVDRVMVQGEGVVEMSFVDLANLVCHVSAESLGLRGDEDPGAMMADAALMARCERIRLAAAVHLGIISDLTCAPPATPWLSIVSSPRTWRNFATGQQHEADDCDLGARLYVAGDVHKAYPGTGSACLGAAAKMPGSIPWQLARAASRSQGFLRIGHPCGVLTVCAMVRALGAEGFKVEEASFTRTARRLADGSVYAAVDRLPWLRGA